MNSIFTFLFVAVFATYFVTKTGWVDLAEEQSSMPKLETVAIADEVLAPAKFTDRVVAKNKTKNQRVASSYSLTRKYN